MKPEFSDVVWIIGPLISLGAAAAIFSLGWLSLFLVTIPLLLLLLSFWELKTSIVRTADIVILVIPLVIYLLLPFLSPGIRSFLAFAWILLFGYGFAIPISSRADRLALSGIIGGTILSLSYLVGAYFRAVWWIPTALLIVQLSSLACGLLYIWRGRKNEEPGRKRTELELTYILMIALLSLFFLLELMTVYPNIFKLTTNDLIYHQSYARRLISDPGKYAHWSYFGFHSILSFAYQLSHPDILTFMASSSILNFFSLLLVAVSFSRLNYRKETLFIWSLFTGFAWIAALKYGSNLQGLEQASKASYKSLTWSQPVMFWVLPLTLGIGLLAFLIYSDMYESGYRRILYVSLGVFLAFMVHVAEALVFVSYLALASILIGKRRESALGAIISGLILTGLYLLPGLYRGSGPSASIYLLGLALISLLLNELRERFLGDLLHRFLRILENSRSKVLIALSSIYVAGLGVWLLHLGEVDVDAIYFLGQVPWFFYPVLLGAAGFLALYSLKDRFSPEYAILVIVSIAMGRLVTYYKLLGGTISYWEYRFPFYAALGLAVLAAPVLNRLIKASRKSLLASLLLGLIIFSGYSSTALSVKHWNYVTSRGMGAIIDEDFEFATKSHFFEEKRIPALTLSSYSLSIAALLTPPSNFRLLAPWISQGPELPLYTLSSLSNSGELAAIMTIGDVGFLERDNESFNYIRNFMGPIHSYPSITVLTLSPPPVLNSSLAIVLPADVYLRRRALVAYELIRSEFPEHTVYLSDDPRAPAGIYIGPSKPTVELKERIPRSPYDLRWLYIWGNFTEGKEGLEVSGKRGVAVTSFELDNGTYQVRACGQMLGYIGLIYDFVNFDNYRFFQVYLDKGFGIYRIVAGGEVKSSRPFKVPVRIGDECVNITLRLENGNVTAEVNGKTYPLPSVDKMGVLGLETGNFSGTITGTVEGVHSLRWNPPPNSKLVSVLGRANLDLTEWVDKGMRNLSTVKTSFNPPELHLGSFSGEMPKVKAVLTGFNATGSIEIVGRPIWYEVNGTKVYLNKSSITVTAKEMSFRNGEGFYMDLDLKEASIRDLNLEAGKMTIRFRLPASIEARGNVTLIRYHQFRSYVRRTKTVHTTRANFTVVMADNAQLLSHLDVPKEDLSPTKLLYKAFDETRYLPEALVIAAITFTVLYYLERRYSWEPKRIKAKRRDRSKRKPRRG